MSDAIRVTNLRFTAASESEVARGLIGWVALELNEALKIQGVAFRRTVDGRYTLSFPARPDGQGGKRFYVRPLDDRARRDLEHQVLQALNIEEAPR